jgi:hypothetical protein
MLFFLLSTGLCLSIVAMWNAGQTAIGYAAMLDEAALHLDIVRRLSGVAPCSAVGGSEELCCCCYQ